MSYYDKYLKYKNKYLGLQKMLGGEGGFNDPVSQGFNNPVLQGLKPAPSVRTEEQKAEAKALVETIKDILNQNKILWYEHYMLSDTDQKLYKPDPDNSLGMPSYYIKINPST